MKKLYFLLFCFLFSLGERNICVAQNTITGKIIDNETQVPLEGVSVLLLNSKGGTALSFALTNAKGEYVLKLNVTFHDSLQVVATILGYAKQTIAVKNESYQLNMSLTPEAINLNEIVVRANKLWLQRDTLNYDVNVFKTEQDRVIGDVLRKMPGIEIAQSGAISYNGQPINRFYIEGSDLLEGKYNLATKNIPAAAVSKVQVLENHQPIKALEDNTFSDQAAINLVLKDGAKSRWLSKIEMGGGAYPFLWDNRLMTMRIGRGLQSINVYKSNNIGNSVTDELRSFSLGGTNALLGGNTEEADWLSLVSPSSLSLSENRILFNQSHLLSANNLLQLNDNYQLRTNISYINNRRNFNTEARTLYYLGDSSLTISEYQLSRRQQHQLDAGFTLTANTASFYLQNNLKARARWNDAHAWTGDGISAIAQQLNTPNHTISNDFQWIKNIKKHSLQAGSFNSYTLLPQDLTIMPGMYESIFNEGNVYSSLHQQLRMNSLFSNNYVAFKTQKQNWRMELKAGFQAQRQEVSSELFPLVGTQLSPLADSFSNDFKLTQYRYSLQTLLGYQGQQLRFSLEIPMNYALINNERHLFFDPVFTLNYEVTAYWSSSIRAGFNNRFGDIRSMMPNYILYNYRSIEKNTGDLLEQTQQNYSVGIFYRNTVAAFFARLSASYGIGTSNLLYDRSFNGILGQRTAIHQANNRDSWAVSGQVSKIIDDWATTLWLDVNYNYAVAEQMAQQQWTRFAMESRSVRPRVLVKPTRWTNMEYETTIARSQMNILEPQSTKSAPMFSLSQFLTWNLNLSKTWQGYVRGEHFYNKTDRRSYPAVFFLDAGVRYMVEKLEFALDVKNIFDTKRYEYSLLNELSESFSAFELRPASLVFKVSWTF